MADLTLTHGDRRTLTISGLVDEAGAAATFSGSDVVRWTARRYVGASTALIEKTSVAGGDIAFTAGQSTATVTVYPEDFDGIPRLAGGLAFVWDAELVLDGDETDVRTLDSGDGVIVGDISIPTGS